MRTMLLACLLSATVSATQAADLTVMTTGAPKQVVQTVADAFAAEGGHKVTYLQDTAGGLKKRAEAGEFAHIFVATPEVLDGLIKAGKVAPGTRIDFASTGVGMGVRTGLPKPDIATVDAFKAALVKAPSIALPDPKAGGTSAVYIEGMIRKLGLSDIVNAKARLKAGGYAADLVASGEAEIVLHQISEILPVKGVTLVGPLPAEIQLTTIYSAALGAGSAENAEARALLAALGGPKGKAAAAQAGMESPR